MQEWHRFCCCCFLGLNSRMSEKLASGIMKMKNGLGSHLLLDRTCFVRCGFGWWNQYVTLGLSEEEESCELWPSFYMEPCCPEATDTASVLVPYRANLCTGQCWVGCVKSPTLKRSTRLGKWFLCDEVQARFLVSVLEYVEITDNTMYYVLSSRGHQRILKVPKEQPCNVSKSYT